VQRDGIHGSSRDHEMFSDSRSTRIVSTTSVVWLDAIQSVDPTRARADVCPERRRDGQRDASRPEAL